MSKKILFLTARTIYPVFDGRRTTLKQMVQQTKEAGAGVYLACIATDAEFSVPQPKEISESIRLFPTKTSLKVWNVLTKTLFGGWMIQNAVYYSRKNQKIVDQFIEKEHFDIIVCDSDRMSQYLLRSKQSGFKKYLDMDDRVSVTLAAQLQNIKENINLYGNFSSQMPRVLLRIFNFFHLGKLIVKMELALSKKFEKRAPHLFEKIFLVSPLEVRSYSNETKAHNIYCLPVAVDYPFFSEQIPFTIRPDSVCFLGNMKIAHNQATLDTLIREVILPLRKDFPISLLVVGQQDEKSVSKFSQYADFVTMTGTVDDVRPYCRSCFCMAAPIVYGSGIKIKILENMAMGVPVITNDVGKSGIEIDDGVNILIANSPKEMIDCVKKLYLNEPFRLQMGFAGQRFILDNHSYQATMPIVTSAILE